MEKKFSIINKTKSRTPRLPFSVMKDDILGEKYSLSLAFVNEKESKKINKQYRQKDRPTNILSFPFNKNSGEILICPSVAKKEAKNFDKTFSQFIGFLVIHGMLHLKGMEHSSKIKQEKMERMEKKYDQKYFGGHRHRILQDKSRGGRIFKRRKNS
jgi:probable rRNA maturation factor